MIWLPFSRRFNGAIRVPPALVLLGCCTCATGQVQRPQAEVVRIAVHAAPLSASAPLIRLFPNQDRMVARNSAIFYHRAIESFGQTEAMWQRAPRFQSGNLRELIQNTPIFYDNYEVWMGAPLNELPLKDMNAWLSHYEHVVEELKRAARSGEVDWGLLPGEDEPVNPFMIVLNDLQNLRGLARMLHIRARVLIAEGKYHEAIETLSLGYKTAHDMEKSGILVGSLIAIACARIMNDALILVQQQADAPNLFWGLSTMPRPLVDTKLALRKEMNWIANGAEFEMLNAKQMSGRSISFWQSAFSTGSEQWEQLTGQSQSSLVWLAIRGYPIATQGLLDRGYEAKTIEAMPVGEVVARYQSLLLQNVRDETLKWLTLPYPEMARFRNQYESAIERTSVNSRIDPRGGVLPVSEFLPGQSLVIDAEIHLQRDLAGLQVIEALRWYLAETGNLPTDLAQIQSLPVPRDPATGEPFRYELDGGVAKLFLPDRVQSRSKIYEISVAN